MKSNEHLPKFEHDEPIYRSEREKLLRLISFPINEQEQSDRNLEMQIIKRNHEKQHLADKKKSIALAILLALSIAGNLILMV